ncbi:hypothetical protein RJ639_010792 [Escallonia herrerae]|uniref:Uncharacterized protein n=1 Tax=Escallonia herrerae TaxID=1293975 RepID=A0AA88VKE9_9ASTE|nr:hypothetical protein RJ639_010792 [Escallonia herrerae]
MDTRFRAATARMSAHETTPGQASSRAVLARTTTSKPSPGRERLMSASRSALLKGVEEMRTEASQPPTRQSCKKRRRAAAAVVGERTRASLCLPGPGHQSRQMLRHELYSGPTRMHSHSH